MPLAIIFNSHLDEINDETKRKVKDWLEAVGLDASSTARERAPHRTGALRNSLTYQVDANGDKVYVGTNIPYAIYQEVGTSRIAGKHYLEFGVTAHKAEYQAMLEQALKQ